MITITRELLRDWHACYSDDRIAELVPAEGMTPLQILDLDIPAEDRLWVVLRTGVMSDRALREIACRCADRACAISGSLDPHSLRAIHVARSYSRGEVTDVELACAARTAAAAASAAEAAAYAAAEAAARTAARTAAYAARTAAYAAARTAADAAAYAAAYAARTAADAARTAARTAADASAADASAADASAAEREAQIRDARALTLGVAR